MENASGKNIACTCVITTIQWVFTYLPLIFISILRVCSIHCRDSLDSLSLHCTSITDTGIFFNVGRNSTSQSHFQRQINVIGFFLRLRVCCFFVLSFPTERTTDGKRTESGKIDKRHRQSATYTYWTCGFKSNATNEKKKELFNMWIRQKSTIAAQLQSQ